MDEAEEPVIPLWSLSTLSRASTFSNLRYGRGMGLNMSSPEKRDREGEVIPSADDKEAPLDRRELYCCSAVVLARCLSILAFRTATPGDTGDATFKEGLAVSPSLTGGSMMESTLPPACPLPLPQPLPPLLSAINIGLEFALGSSSSENRTRLELDVRLFFGRSDEKDEAIDAASPLSADMAADVSDVSDEMEERKMGRGGGLSVYD